MAGGAPLEGGLVRHPILPVTKASNDLNNKVLIMIPNPVGPELSAIRSGILATGNNLSALTKVDFNPSTPQGLEDLVKEVAANKKEVKKVYSKLVEHRKNLEDFLTAKDVPTADKPKARAASSGLDEVIATLATYLQPESSIEMYEVKNVGGVIKLRKVQFTP